jgi:hypothetical protein
LSPVLAFLALFFFPAVFLGAQITGTPAVIVGWNQFDSALAADVRPAL